MTIKLLERWNREHGDEGAYSVLAGFEAAVRGSDFENAYDELDIYDQIKLYSLVTDLIVEAAEEQITEE